MSQPYYGPDEDATTIFLERTFIAGDLLCGLGYGIQLVMFVYCVNYLWSQRRTRKHAPFMLAYIICIFIVETLFVAVQARTVELAYIDNRNYPGGPWAWFLASQALPVNVMFEATLFLITFLCDALVLWRCWIIWRAAGRHIAWGVTAFPIAMLLASFVMGTLWTLQSSQPGLSFYSSLPEAYGISYYTISLSINIVLTILIVIRLMQYRATVMKSLPPAHAKHYLSLATVLVESAALYTCFGLIFLITYAVNNPINQIFLGLAQAAQQISTYLIIYRLADGRAWKTTTLARDTLTTMAFDPEARRATTQAHTGVISAPVFASLATTSPTDTGTDGRAKTPDTPDIFAFKEKGSHGSRSEQSESWEDSRARVEFAV